MIELGVVADHHLVQVLDQERVAGLEDQHIVVHLMIHDRVSINMYFFTWSTIHSTRKELFDDGRYPYNCLSSDVNIC